MKLLSIISLLAVSINCARGPPSIPCGIPAAEATSDLYVQIFNAGGPTAGADLAMFFTPNAIVQGGGNAETSIGRSNIQAFLQEFIDTTGVQVTVLELSYRCLAPGVFLEFGTIKLTIGTTEEIYFQNSVGYVNLKTGAVQYEYQSVGQ